MKLKNDDLIEQIKNLQHNINSLNLDIQAIKKEYDKYIFSNSEDIIMKQITSLPLETLKDFLEYEKNNKRTTYSLKNIKYKSLLRKTHEQKVNELEAEKIKLNEAKINCLQYCIEEIKKQYNIIYY